MVLLCLDKDLLKLENMIYKGQGLEQFIVLRGGGATLSDNNLLCGGVDFVASGIGKGDVAYVSEQSTGFSAFLEVERCVASNQIELCPLRASGQSLRPNTSIGSLSLLIVSFKPVIEMVSLDICRLIGVEPAVESDFESGDVSNADILARAVALGTLESIFLSSQNDDIDSDNSLFDKKRVLYGEMFKKAKDALVLQMETAEGKKRLFVFGTAEAQRI